MMRRLFIVASIVCAGHALAQTPAHNSSAPKMNEPVSLRAVEMTYFKSIDGKKDALKKFIMANWFAYDKAAVNQGLMVRYQLLDSPNSQSNWDVMVISTYVNTDGYVGIKERFDAIRKAHKVIAVEGETSFKTFGAIVDSKTVFEVLGENSLP